MKRFFMVLSVIDFILLLGTAGIADQETAETFILFLRCLGSIFMIIIGYFGMKRLEDKKSDQKRDRFRKMNQKHKHRVA